MIFFPLGNAGDSLSMHQGQAFSTKDRDHDSAAAGHCATMNTGAWWYNNCHRSNLNGQYLNGTINKKGVSWWHWKNTHYSLKRSEMKIRTQIFFN